MPWSPAAKRYNVRLILLTLLYGVFLTSAVYGFKHHLVGGAVAWVVATLPALPLIGVFAAMGRYLVEEQDEYVRMLLVRQMLWAMGFALSCATVWGFLEGFDLIRHIDGYWIVAAWYFGQGIGACVNRVTLGARVACS
jgi:hypothetical protein